MGWTLFCQLLVLLFVAFLICAYFLDELVNFYKQTRGGCNRMHYEWLPPDTQEERGKVIDEVTKVLTDAGLNHDERSFVYSELYNRGLVIKRHPLTLFFNQKLPKGHTVRNIDD